MQKTGGGVEIRQDFISFSPVRCCPTKARSQPAAQDCAPKRISASRNGAWVWGCVSARERVGLARRLAGAGRPASQRVFQGQLELPVGSGCDITGRRKTLGPGFL